MEHQIAELWDFALGLITNFYWRNRSLLHLDYRLPAFSIVRLTDIPIPIFPSYF